MFLSFWLLWRRMVRPPGVHARGPPSLPFCVSGYEGFFQPRWNRRIGMQ